MLTTTPPTREARLRVQGLLPLLLMVQQRSQHIPRAGLPEEQTLALDVLEETLAEVRKVLAGDG